MRLYPLLLAGGFAVATTLAYAQETTAPDTGTADTQMPTAPTVQQAPATVVPEPSPPPEAAAPDEDTPEQGGTAAMPGNVSGAAGGEEQGESRAEEAPQNAQMAMPGMGGNMGRPHPGCMKGKWGGMGPMHGMADMHGKGPMMMHHEEHEAMEREVQLLHDMLRQMDKRMDEMQKRLDLLQQQGQD